MENLSTVYERDYQELTALNEKYKAQNIEFKDLDADQKREYVRDYNKVLWDAQTKRPYKSLNDRAVDLLIGLGTVRVASRFFIGRKDDGDGSGGDGGGKFKTFKEMQALKWKKAQPMPVPVKKDVDVDMFNR